MQTNNGQPCHICGDGANAELIVICFQCRKSREHIYCMRPNLDKFPAEWHCEACRGDTLVHQEACHSDGPRRCHEEEVKSPSEREQKSAIGNECSEIPDASKKIGSPSGKPAARLLSRDFVPNKVDKGKVKYLPVEHIYALSSGAKWKQPSLGGSSSQKGFFGNNRRLISKTPPARVFATKRYSYEKDHGHSSPGHAKSLQKQVAKPSQQLQELNLQVRLAHKSSATGNSTSQTVLTTRGKRATNDEARHSPLEHTVPVVNGVKEKVEHEKTLLPLDKHAGKMDSILSKDCARKEEHVNVIACHQDARSEEENLPNPPAVNALWKGSFEIHKSLEIYGGFQAYPPAILSQKACSIASKMSKVLPFTLQPRSDVWPKTFRTDFPSAYDIALYFLADDFDREKYNGLVERMEKHDLSLKSQSQWDGVELLIFTSRELPAESQKLNRRFYLWGVFCSMEGRHSSSNLNGNQHASSFPSLGDSANAVHGHDDDQVVDMQIDMLGGKEVGSIDVASRVKSNLPIETSIAAPNSHEVKREPTSDLDAPPGFSRRVTSNAADKGPLAISRVQSNLPVQTSNAAIHLHVVKREPTSDLDTPPGFSKCATSNVADKGPLAMLLVRTPVAQDLDVPPGFSTPNKLNASDSPSKIFNTSQRHF